MFSFHVDGIEELERNFAEGARALSEAVRKGVEAGIAEGVAEARATHAYTDRTGNLTRSIDGRVLVSAPGGATGEMKATMPYASFVEDGTGPHIILPLDYKWGGGYSGRPTSRVTGKRVSVGAGAGRGRALRWTDEGGDVHFATIVHHPGSKPYPFMGQAYIKCSAVIVREVETGVACVLQLIRR